MIETISGQRLAIPPFPLFTANTQIPISVLSKDSTSPSSYPFPILIYVSPPEERAYVMTFSALEEDQSHKATIT